MRSLFVTVGSTKFDKLIETFEIQSQEFVEFIDRFQIEKIVIQHGRSKAPKLKLPEKYQITMCDYLQPAEMSKELASASVIITHGGAGTIFEILRGNCDELEALVVVENGSLMDAHQSELIEALIEMECPVQRGNLDNLFDEISNNKSEIEVFKLPEPNYNLLATLINTYMAE